MARQPDPIKQENLILSAIKLFTQKGYRDTSMADIAEDSGLVVSNAYIYYENKEELLRVVVRRMMEEHSAIFLKLARKTAGQSAQDFVNLCFNELEKIRPRVLFIIQCNLVPSLRPVFENIDLDYSFAFAPYFNGWPEEYAAPTARALMALSDSFFLVGDRENVKEAAVHLLTNAGTAIAAPTRNEEGV